MDNEYKIITESKSKIMTCGCDHQYQDSVYGKKKRLHNKKDTGGWRCTVCGEAKNA